ncbi:MAG TPA: ABC transporter substrate-binding protein [Casimicrobiaceae bacterium]|nr:ABC transporter substrate-binding protein [Casimicrobiaceae bacterium]
MAVFRQTSGKTLGFLHRTALVACLAAFALPAFAADPNKVVRIQFPTAETGFDPARVSDSYSNVVNEAIFEGLLSYDYLARPAKLVPGTAESMPDVADNGRTYTFRIRKGIYFAPDPAFKGKRRELTADDYIYSFKRFVDPALRSPWAFMIEDKIEGLSDLAAAAKKSGKFDYSARVAGLEALDRHTLRIRLKSTDYVFLYTMAHTPFGAVAREVIEAYATDTMAHPVGTGPYRLKEWKRANKIILEANPEYRGFIWDFAAVDPAWDDKLVRDMSGKRMPQIGRVEISIIEEEQSRWLAFNQKELDYINLPATFRPQVIDAERNLRREWADKGVSLFKTIEPDITYAFFNFRDPVVGGFSKEKIALRRAIIMAYDVEEEIRVIRKGQAIRAVMPIPFGVVGHDVNWKPLNNYDPELANKLLDHFGYKRGKDDYRTLPDGKPLTLRYATGTTAIEREFNELWKKSMDAIGVRIEFQTGKFAEHLKAAKACQLMMWGAAWLADYPDGENFMQLLYGPNTGQSNNGCYESKAYDAFYQKMLTLPDSKERNRLFLEMTRQMEVDGAWVLNTSRERNQLIWPWVKGYKKHPIMNAEFVYMDIDHGKGSSPSSPPLAKR